MADNPKPTAEDFLSNVWGKRAGGVEVPNVDWERPIRREDIQYLLDHWPYLQILSTDPQFDPDMEPAFIRAESGWVIHDYGAALSSSPGEFLYGGFAEQLNNDEDEGGGEGSAANPGKGTIIKQAVDTAAEMIAIVLDKGWPGVEIIDGHELMKWSAWNSAQDHGLLIEGYKPDEKAHQRRERIKRIQTGGPAVTPQVNHR